MSERCWKWGAVWGLVIALSGGCGESSATKPRQEGAGEAEHGDHRDHDEEKHDGHDHDEHEHDKHDHDEHDHDEHEHGEHEHDEHDHAHLDPEHRPPHFVAAVKRLEELADSLDAEVIPSAAYSVTWVKEAEDLWRWLPELAAATDLSEPDWTRIQEASNAIYTQWKGQSSEALPDPTIRKLWRTNVEVLKGLANSVAEATRQEEIAFRLATERAQEESSESLSLEREADSSEEQK